MKLYGSPFSPRWRRVAIAAAELGAPVDLVVLDVTKGETKAPEYLAKNAMGKMPTFEDDDGWTLWESCAILVYLAEQRPEKDLFPTDARGRAEALRWLFWTTAHLDPFVEQLWVQKLLAPKRGKTPDAALCAAASGQLERFLPVLEAQLAKRPHLVGAKTSLVDVALGASIDALWRTELGVDRAPYPAITAWHAKLAERPSWSAGAMK